LFQFYEKKKLKMIFAALCSSRFASPPNFPSLFKKSHDSFPPLLHLPFEGICTYFWYWKCHVRVFPLYLENLSISCGALFETASPEIPKSVRNFFGPL